MGDDGKRMPVEQEPVENEAAGEPEPSHWLLRLGALLYVLFCFEVGVFLLFFPWTEWWTHSFFSNLGAEWYAIWSSPYLRGAISGVGVIDIGISFSEVFRLRRFAGGGERRSLQ